MLWKAMGYFLSLQVNYKELADVSRMKNYSQQKSSGCASVRVHVCTYMCIYVCMIFALSSKSHFMDT
jgi:hypothetical protein